MLCEIEVEDMSAYGNLAEVYDEFMDEVPYEKWSEQVIQWLREYQIMNGVVLDLGCGTGSMTELLAKARYEMMGIDISEDMLAVAQNKRYVSDYDILYLQQDMRELELHGNVKAVISACDAVNYILEPDELCRVFERVNQYLEPKGIFIFDFNTTYKYREIMGQQIFAEDTNVGSYVWDNDYDEETGINEYQLTFFVKENELYRKYQEIHYQRGYALEEMKELLKKSGLEFLGAYDDYSNEEISQASERICIIARENGK